MYSARRKQRDLTRRRAIRFKYYATKRCLLYVSDLNLSRSTSELLQGPRRAYGPAATRRRRAAPPRDITSSPPRSWRRHVSCSAVGGSKSPASATSVLRRRAARTPATASSPGREVGRSRHRRLGDRASHSPTAAHPRAGFWRGSQGACQPTRLEEDRTHFGALESARKISFFNKLP